ncbi:MAG TPA: 2-oxoglutarate and iron-dependent oxygenase domain-containing protein [Pseudomonadota bacterium]|nr:2-oxoglutarate and iron-dependent oxygenase domain-containing protein [Pseudomonadota bacterium]
MSQQVPIVDLRAPRATVAKSIFDACRSVGFFYVVGHDVDEALTGKLMERGHQFFALSDDIKARFAMPLGGRAWRGWFPLGGELTSGRPDWKEGLYLGTELSDDHPRVRAGVPLHGRNLIPGEDLIPGFRDSILTYIDQVTRLGHQVMAAIADSLDLPCDYFFRRYTADPLILFRIFQYPSRPVPTDLDVRYGVGEHTDYGLLTLLRQDDVGGLMVRQGEQFVDAPPIPKSFVCNIGDMLDRMTGGLYRSTPHRVRLNQSGRNRLSLPLFFDPDFDAQIEPIRTVHDDDAATRWDQASVHSFDGTYGEYVMAKVGKVFPVLKQTVLSDPLADGSR